MGKVTLFVILVLIHETACQNITDGYRIVHSQGPEYKDLMFLFIAVLIACIIRLLIIRYNVPTPYAAFMVIIGSLWGVFAYYNEIVMLCSTVIYMNPNEIIYVYYPVLIFQVSFCMDSAIFIKVLSQVMVIGFPVCLMTGVIFGSVMRLILDRTWSVRGGVLFGIICCPVYPASIVYLLKRQSSLTKQISVLLEGEAILSMINAYITNTLFMNHIVGVVEHWYQFLCISLRFIVLGLLTGYVMGLCARYMLHKMYTNRMSVFMLSFVMPLFTYAISSLYISGCGAISTAVVGCMMAAERSSMAKDIESFLMDLWEMIGFVLDVVMCTTISTLCAVKYAPSMSWHHYVLVLVTFMIYYAVRFISFLMFSPIISRLGYGMNLKNMMVCVWSGIKSPISLILVRVFISMDLRAKSDPTYFFQITGLYFLSLLINGSFTRTLMDFLGMRTISVARQMNMNNCIRHMFTKRERTIAILKMDRFLADTNWPRVIDATNVRHPYHMELEMDEEDVFLWGYHFTNCPDCKKEIPEEPTPRELRDLTREAKMRILKAKKMSYSRQFENGMMSKEGIRLLCQVVELAMDSNEAVIEFEGLERRFTKEGCVTRWIRNRVQELKKTKGSNLRPPRKYIRRLCFNLVVNKTWERWMIRVVAINVVFMVVDTFYNPLIFDVDTTDNTTLQYSFVIIEVVFCLIYGLEFVMKILAYSFLRIWQDGVYTYFKGVWNVINFIVLFVLVLELCYDIDNFSTQGSSNEINTFRLVVWCLQWLRVIRLLRLAEFFYPKLIRYLDRGVDSKLAFTYELGKSYTTGEKEILDMLPYMIDNQTIREEIKKKIEADRVLITKLLGIVQKEKPWVAITVKTKQAIRTILKSMKEAINQLKITGWVDSYEQGKLDAEMGELYKKVNSIKTVKPSPPKVIFKEVAWMGDEQAVIDFLFQHVTVRKFEPGDVVFGYGSLADGIYIMVTGLLMLTYTPDKAALDSLREYGRIPIADYLSSTKFEEPAVDYIVSGNCVGELSTLTQRPYNCTITADAHSQVYVLNHNILRKAMDLSSDPATGLECRIWKEVSVRIAIPVLMAVPAYQNFSQDQIKYALERAFVPNLSNYKIFAVTEMIQDIVLIDGIVADFNTRDTFVAPCWVPRTVQKLIMPKSSLMNVPVVMEAKLLIIPEKDMDEYDVMIIAEETCELVSSGSALKCLQHAAEQKVRQRKRLKIRGATGISGHGSHRNLVGDGGSTETSMSQLTLIKEPSESGSMYYSSNLSDTATSNLSEEKVKRAFDYSYSKRRF